ncbi:D-2-hydroxyacid dehydrogenase family protein [Mycobacterium sp. DSM 3803]|nr:D-2-hydroxyacid dehydrogenase family protein [Mycobacterium sp. DSM 3803]
MRIVVLDDYQRCAAGFADWSVLAGTEIDFVPEHLTGDALVRRVGAAEVVVAMRERVAFDAALLDRLGGLRLLVTTGMVNASIDLDAARERSVTVCGTRGLASPAAELTWALIHAVTRHVPRSDADVRAGRWQRTIGTDLAGARLGVVGLGRLGSRVATVGLAFGMDVVAWSTNLTTEAAAEVGVRRIDRDELFETSDVVTLHLRLSDRTRGIVGPDELGRMRSSAVLINTSRGPLVDEGALIDALSTSRIAGAGLDVFDHEPLPDGHPLARLDNVVLTPHLGYVTTGSYEIFYRDAVEDIDAWRSGSPIRVLT